MDGSSLEILPEHIQEKIWKMKRELEKKEKLIRIEKLHEPKHHLYLYFDLDNPDKALILYQKKNNWSQILWDMKFNTFLNGQWLTHSVIKPQYCCYYGGLFIYDYIESRKNGYNRYNVLCQPPYFTALLLMKKSNYYGELHFRKGNRPGIVFTGINFPIKASTNHNLYDMLGFIEDITENFVKPNNLILSDKNKFIGNTIFDNKDISIINNTITVGDKNIWNSDSLEFSMIKPPIDYPICVKWDNKLITWDQQNIYKDFMNNHLRYSFGKFTEWSVLKQYFQKLHNNIKINIVKQYFIDNLGQLKMFNRKQGFKNWELY